MLQSLRSKTKGFTIIEVLIVLAIAGLIIMIVFFAIPAAQRNSRNTQIRNDATTVAGYVGEYSTNNNGALPVSICYDAASGSIGMHSAATGCSTTTHLVGRVRPNLTLAASATQPTATNTINVALGYRCNAGTNSIGTATARAIAIGFVVETAGSPANQCLEG